MENFSSCKYLSTLRYLHIAYACARVGERTKVLTYIDQRLLHFKLACRLRICLKREFRLKHSVVCNVRKHSQTVYCAFIVE